MNERPPVDESNHTDCPQCGRYYRPEITKRPNFHAEFELWLSGNQNIQHIWPEVPELHREQLLTGLCSEECYKRYVGPLGEEDF